MPLLDRPSMSRPLPAPYEVSPRVRQAIQGLASEQTGLRPHVGVISDASAMRGYIARCLRPQFDITASAVDVPTLIHLAEGHGLQLIVADLLTLEHEEERVPLLRASLPDVPLLVLSQVQRFAASPNSVESVPPSNLIHLPASGSEIRQKALALLAQTPPNS